MRARGIAIEGAPSSGGPTPQAGPQSPYPPAPPPPYPPYGYGVGFPRIATFSNIFEDAFPVLFRNVGELLAVLLVVGAIVYGTGFGLRSSPT